MDLKSLIPASRGTSLSVRDFHPIAGLQREIDRLFEDFGRNLPVFGSRDLMPVMDVVESDKEIEIAVELPGLEEKDVTIDVSDNVLTIKGEKKSEKEEKDKNYRVVERSYGAFSRVLELPKGVNPDAIKAHIAKGVLKVTVPKPAPAQSKTIEVKTAA